MRRYSCVLICLCLFTSLFALDNKIIRLTQKEIEGLFLTQNLELLAEQMNIDVAEAAIVQAKLWENPSLSISEVNLWSTSSQREGEDVMIPPLFGSFGKNTEFSLELSQLIRTANKRGKLVRMEKVSKEMAIAQFEEVLRGLKTELRNSIYELVFAQSYKEVLGHQSHSLKQLTDVYARQVKEGNLAKSEWLRLQSALFEIDNEKMEVETEWNALQKNLKVLLHLPPEVIVEVISDQQEKVDPEQLALAELIDLATDHRPDLRLAGLQTSLMERSLAFERAQRVPDLTISANYDRYGGVWKDFIGFGVSVDLPFWNRNQGNIKAARIQIEQSRLEVRQQENIVWNEIAEAFNNYSLVYRFHSRIVENPLLDELDGMMEVYTRNLMERNISMLEYIDFMEAYKSNKETMLNASKNLSRQLEELQYTIGTDIK
ncbi:MAG: TolC family protein [Tannerellaceae bacterium]|nr:TolC family protein [Tannerellaceae bacterium]